MIGDQSSINLFSVAREGGSRTLVIARVALDVSCRDEIVAPIPVPSPRAAWPGLTSPHLKSLWAFDFSMGKRIRYASFALASPSRRRLLIVKHYFPKGMDNGQLTRRSDPGDRQVRSNRQWQIKCMIQQ